MTPATQKAYSIQRQLLNSLLIGLPIIWLSITLISVWRLSHEINEINDTQITQLARYLIGISQDVKLHLTNPANEPKILNLENGLLSGDLGDAEEFYCNTRLLAVFHMKHHTKHPLFIILIISG